MDRRSFLTSLIGGFALAGSGGVALAASAKPAAIEPDGATAGDTEALAARVDAADAEFSQYYYYRRRLRWRRRYYRRPYGFYRRPRRFYRGRRFDWRARRR